MEQKRMRKEQMIEKWYNALNDMWRDVQDGEVTPSTIKFSRYLDKWHIAHGPRKLYLPYISSMLPPTFDDAKRAHLEYKAHIHDYNEKKKSDGNSTKVMTESAAVEFLLNTGRYRIMKMEWNEIGNNQ